MVIKRRGPEKRNFKTSVVQVSGYGFDRIEEPEFAPTPWLNLAVSVVPDDHVETGAGILGHLRALGD
jgi:hypothetical protein